MSEVITKEKALKEVEAWLDYKKVKDGQKEALKGQVSTLVDAMQAGEITMDANTFVITQNLQFPVESLFDKLEYRPRIEIGAIHKVSAAVKANDFDGKTTAYISALTGKGFSHIQKMDSEDYKIGQAIALFFM
jgi:hypothetical protein